MNLKLGPRFPGGQDQRRRRIVGRQASSSRGSQLVISDRAPAVPVGEGGVDPVSHHQHSK